MGFEEIIIPACITVFSLGLLIISFLSYQKHKNTKLLFVSLVFLVFFVRGVLLSLLGLHVFSSTATAILSSPYSGLFDLGILLLLFIATLKR